MENWTIMLINLHMSYFDTKEVNEKLKDLFKNLESAAKTNIVIIFVLLGSKRVIIGINLRTKILFQLKNCFYCVPKRYAIFVIKLQAKNDDFDVEEPCTQ